MKHPLSVLPCLLLPVLVPAACQQPDAQPDPGAVSAEEQHELVGSVGPLFETVKGYIVAAAEQMPEENYGYQPTPEVRTFGQIIGHVAMAQYWFCNAANDQAQEPENYEELTDKASLVDAIRSAFDYCADAYAMSDARALEQVELWGESGTRLWVLTFNLTHDWEHYGNLVTYMRANGLVPPSSQGGM